MIRLTGALLLSLFCVLPLKAEQAPPHPNTKPAVCPLGSTYCAECGGCLAAGHACSQDNCSAMLAPLSQKEDAVYLIEEGTVFKCKNDAFIPLLDKEKGTYTCGSK